MDIPNEADWRSESWGLETSYAYKNFFGKDMDEAVKLFEKSALDYQEDLVYMPLKCFRFYARAYISYILSDASRRDCDGANCFFTLVKAKAKEVRSSALLFHETIQALHHLRDKQQWFDAPEKIYGNFAKRADQCLKLLGDK